MVSPLSVACVPCLLVQGIYVHTVKNVLIQVRRQHAAACVAAAAWCLRLPQRALPCAAFTTPSRGR